MASVFEALKSNTAEIEAAKQKVIDINGAMSKSFDELTDAEAGGTVVGPRGVPTTVMAEKQQLSADIAEEAANAARASTINYEQHSNDLLGQIKELSSSRDQKLAEINAINSSSNPLEHIMGIVTIPFKAAQAQGLTAAADAKAKELETVNQLMHSSARVTASIQTRVTEETAASLAEALASDQKIAAIKTRIMAQQTNSKNITDVLNMSGQQLANKVNEFNIGEAMDMRNLRKAQIQQMMDMRAEAAKDRKVSDMAFELINSSLMSNGKAPLQEELRDTIGHQLNRPGPAGDMLRELYANGVQTAANNGVPQQGANPVEAAMFREKIGGYKPTTEPERETLELVEYAMATDKAVAMATKPAERMQAMNDAVRKKLEADQMDINTNPDSLAKPISWATMSASEAFRNNRLYKEIISPQITDNIASQAADPKEFFKRIATAVKNKQATINEAEELYGNYVNASILTNNQASGLQKLTGYRQEKFMVKLPQPRMATRNLVNWPGTDTSAGLTSSVEAGINKFKTILPHNLVLIDGTNKAQRLEAFAAYISGELKEPTQDK